MDNLASRWISFQVMNGLSRKVKDFSLRLLSELLGPLSLIVVQMKEERWHRKGKRKGKEGNL